MKLFVRGLIASGLFLAGLVFTGCSSPPTLDNIPDGKVQSGSPAPALAGMPAASEDQTNSEVAHFHVGETVNVTFSGPPDPLEPHEELIKEDGNITLPLIGSIQALGKTAGELQNEIHNLYVPKYYVRLTVTVKPGDLVYYVSGEVNSHGSRELYVGKTTVTTAITSAGGMDDFASHKVWLIRAGGQRIKVYYDDALQDPSKDPPVYPGDQIVVPRRIF